MTLAATTISIVLTFGTSAIVDRKKRNAEKRDMVMMIMYDMRSSMAEIEQCDNGIHQFIDLQLDVIEHPEKHSELYANLLSNIPILTYTTTTENIFKSNIETINTIGNILFVETVSAFYDIRAKYKKEVTDGFADNLGRALYDSESLSDFNSTTFAYYSRLYFLAMRRDYEQCKAMMKVNEKDLETFSTQREKVFENIGGNRAADETGEVIEEKKQLDLKFQKARSGKK